MGSSLDTIAVDAAARSIPRTGGRLGRRRVADRVARWIVTAGGLGIIAGIGGILAFIVIEIGPLLRPASVVAGALVAGTDGVAAGPLRALVLDEYRSFAVGLTERGEVRVFRIAGGEVGARADLAPLLQGERPSVFEATTDGGGLAVAGGSRLVVVPVSFGSVWEEGTRRVIPTLGEPQVLDAGAGRRIAAMSVRLGEAGSVIAAAALEDGGIAIVERAVKENEISGETSVAESRHELATPVPVRRIVRDGEHGNIFASAGPRIYWWTGSGDGEPAVVENGAPVTALAMLLGERSLLAGDESGTVSVWFPVREEGNRFRLTRIRGFAGEKPVREIKPSWRDKGFLALEAGGRLRLHHSTSERTVWTGTPEPGALAVAYAPKADGAAVAGAAGLTPLEVRNPHPDVSLKALFGKTWYEGYERPEYVWQSTGGTDDFETKLSLVPLLFGTVKGTIYSLLLAIPLAVLGAMYTSQFMHPRLRSYVKPAVELMAALPSVVLGFLAGLWLAPRMEDGLVVLALAMAVVPAFVVLGGLAWTSLPRPARQRFPAGAEVAVFAIAIVVGLAFSSSAAPVFERAVFHGSFRGFVVNTLGLGYDQRNALVVGLAMGFAVIPIIFAISEDALSNVPASLTSASLALGANRWQTVSRVVLPAASPGIFSGVMVGFGRAVGETMIVLMATGNTPILDWNPFNGFRTLSANIAVEIPEAPYGGTLYRTLFLAALLLFMMTFAVNTIAELVRQKLRRKYSEV